MLPRRPAEGPVALTDEGPDPEAELRARLILYRAFRDAGHAAARRRRRPATACSTGSRPPRTPPASRAPARRRPRRSSPALLVLALDRPRPDRAATRATAGDDPPDGHAHVARGDHPRGAPRRAGRRAPGPAGRRPRPGRHRGHVPRAARADEAPRDRRRAGRAVGADRRPRDDRRGARRVGSRRVASTRPSRSTSRWSRSHDRARDGRADEAAAPRRGRRTRAPTDAPQPPGELTEAQLEALLFVAERPLSRREIAALAGVDRGDRRRAARRPRGRAGAIAGIRLVLSGERVELATAPEAGALIARYVGADAVRLSPAALETLAIVAYRQPVDPGRRSSASAASTPTTRSGPCCTGGSIVEQGRSDAPGPPVPVRHGLRVPRAVRADVARGAAAARPRRRGAAGGRGRARPPRPARAAAPPVTAPLERRRRRRRAPDRCRPSGSPEGPRGRRRGLPARRRRARRRGPGHASTAGPRASARRSTRPSRRSRSTAWRFGCRDRTALPRPAQARRRDVDGPGPPRRDDRPRPRPGRPVRGARLYPVGRLDQDSEGLILLTNDGDWAEHVLHPRYGVEREYAVALSRPLTREQAEALETGVELDRGRRDR